MLAYLAAAGRRKFTLCLCYLGCCTMLDYIAITGAGSIDLSSMAGLASLNTGLATGLGVIVWGNIQEHRAKNGNQ